MYTFSVWTMFLLFFVMAHEPGYDTSSVFHALMEHISHLVAHSVKCWWKMSLAAIIKSGIKTNK